LFSSACLGRARKLSIWHTKAAPMLKVSLFLWEISNAFGYTLEAL